MVNLKSGVKRRVLFDKNRVPQLSLFDVKLENGVKIGVSNLLFFDNNRVSQLNHDLLNFLNRYGIFYMVRGESS